MTLFSRRSGRTPVSPIETVLQEQLNSGSSYRVQSHDGTFSISANRVGRQVYYYATKRVRGRLRKIHVAKCGEVTPEKVRKAIVVLLAEILAHWPETRQKGVDSMPAREKGLNGRLVVDLLEALDVVVAAPLEEQRGLYEAWQRSTSRTLALVLSTDECATWEAFSTQDVEWTSESATALCLKSVRAFLRALALASRTEERAGIESERARFEHLTRRARQVLTLAQAEAERLQHDHIGTEHLLVGLAQVGVSSEILNVLGVAVSQVQALTEEMVGRGTVPTGRTKITLRNEVKRTLERAVSEARNKGDRSIDTTHLLLALMQQQECTAVDVLRRMGIPPETVYEATMQRREERPH